MNPTDFRHVEYRKVLVDTRVTPTQEVISQLENEGWRIEHVAIGEDYPSDPVVILTFRRPRF